MYMYIFLQMKSGMPNPNMITWTEDGNQRQITSLRQGDAALKFTFVMLGPMRHEKHAGSTCFLPDRKRLAVKAFHTEEKHRTGSGCSTHKTKTKMAVCINAA